ncbi:MAG: hypothetical protein PHR82_09015 [Endomicrobiaceae bacterium]|jgi:hypothetical protein|nr:hypothetical protein [Endomicrobiaceae bacterium]
MKNGFDVTGFMKWLEDNFNGFENSFLRGVVENLIEYGFKHERTSKDQFCYWLSDMLPEVEFWDVAAFIADESLTGWGLEQKRMRLDHMA